MQKKKQCNNNSLAYKRTNHVIKKVMFSGYT